MYPPAWLFAVNAGATAIPDELVLTVTLVAPPGKVPPVPDEGAANVTTASGTSLPCASVTVTASGIAKRVPVAVDWTAPTPAVIFDGEPARL